MKVIQTGDQVTKISFFPPRKQCNFFQREQDILVWKKKKSRSVSLGSHQIFSQVLCMYKHV